MADATEIAELALSSPQGSPTQNEWAEAIRIKRIASLRRSGHYGVNLPASVVETKMVD